jgi:putative cell wall-binding protein
MTVATVVGVMASILVSAGAAPASADDPPGESFAPIVTRISGVDRYDMGVRIAQQTRPFGAAVVYVASGANFPDALSAGPAAVRDGGALLLVPPGGMTAGVESELGSLQPARVVIVGGPASVPDAVVTRISNILPHATVVRITGADRYAVSRAVVASAFGAGSTGAFVATGRDFPDALSAGAAAGAAGSPVVLVDGAATSADTQSLQLIRDLGATWIALMGGPLSVSTGVERSLAGTASLNRISGPDRFAVSVELNVGNLSADFSTVYLATGNDYPDALAGGVLAGSTNSPLFVTPKDCVPQVALALMSERGTRKVVLLGGPASLSASVFSLTPCAW